MARILRQVTVVRDGMHNAFTDLQYWQDAYWVSYRKADNHVSPDGEACVSVSVDRTRFREAARVKAPGDNRDPKLVAMSAERIALYFTARNLKGEFSQYVAFSNDGFKWEEPTQCDVGTNRWIWRIRQHAGRYYGAAYGWEPKDGRMGRQYLDFLVSDDLVRWEKLSQIGKDSDKADESDFHFQKNGEVWLVARSERKTHHSWLYCARPPYARWKALDLKTVIHCPVILEHKGALYVSGRCAVDATFPFLSRMSLGLWRLERKGVTPALLIPATGDCAYPGLIKDPAGRICLSYYSQHAYHMGVIPYLLRYEPLPPTHDKGQLLSPDDVYFAELELP
jgi:hypothetical protein